MASTSRIWRATRSGSASTSDAAWRSTSQPAVTSVSCRRRSAANTTGALWNASPSTSTTTFASGSTRSPTYPSTGWWGSSVRTPSLPARPRQASLGLGARGGGGGHQEPVPGGRAVHAEVGQLPLPHSPCCDDPSEGLVGQLGHPFSRQDGGAVEQCPFRGHDRSGLHPGDRRRREVAADHPQPGRGRAEPHAARHRRLHHVRFREHPPQPGRRAVGQDGVRPPAAHGDAAHLDGDLARRDHGVDPREQAGPPSAAGARLRSARRDAVGGELHQGAHPAAGLRSGHGSSLAGVVAGGRAAAHPVDGRERCGQVGSTCRARARTVGVVPGRAVITARGP